MTDARPETTWKHILIPVIAITILALYPQLSLWIARGAAWQGSYVVSNYDEAAYSAYINALIEGKPRKNDPFVGIDDPRYESLYSIQFVPAYSIALPARVFGFSTSSAFILLSVFIAIVSFLALFWFINSVTRNPTLSAAGTLVVLCLGTAVAYQGELRHLIEGRVLIDFFPFLRRYQPGFAFPIFFVFCGLVWRSFTHAEWKRTIAYAIVSGITFAVLVFSYFYLWTAAAAWLGCIVLINFVGSSEYRRRIIWSVGIIGLSAIAALVPYFMMLANRSPDLDSVQLLSNTHAPQFASPSLIFGLLIIAVMGACAFRGRVSMSEPTALLTTSFAATPVVLFNQQILTGRSLQPVHYEIFIANYLVLAAAILLTAVLLKSGKGENTAKYRKILTYATCGAVIWGMIEAAGSSGRNAVYADIRDESVAAIRFIKRNEAGKPSDVTRPVVLATNFVTSDFIPTVSTFRPLWNPHTPSAGGIGVVENKRLFYLYLYYSGFTEKDLAEALTANSFEVTAAVFGSERALPSLSNGLAIARSEISGEAQKYAEFVKNFDGVQASDPALSYVVVPTKAEPNFANLDRWYQRDNGTIQGIFQVYTLEPKFTAQH